MDNIFKKIKNKYRIEAACGCSSGEADASGGANAHHNAKGLALEDAVDSFMHYVLKMSDKGMKSSIDEYNKSQNVSDSKRYDFALKLKRIGDMLEDEEQRLVEEKEEKEEPKEEGSEDAEI
jgi:hypothetical protein